MNLHENKDVFTAAIQLASTPKQEGGLDIKPQICSIYFPSNFAEIMDSE